MKRFGMVLSLILGLGLILVACSDDAVTYDDSNIIAIFSSGGNSDIKFYRDNGYLLRNFDDGVPIYSWRGLYSIDSANKITCTANEWKNELVGNTNKTRDWTTDESLFEGGKKSYFYLDSGKTLASATNIWYQMDPPKTNTRSWHKVEN